MVTFWSVLEANSEKLLEVILANMDYETEADFFQTIKAMPSDYHRVRLLANLLEKYELYVPLRPDIKSDALSQEYRAMGEQHHITEKEIVAQKFYHLATLQADTDNALGTVYAHWALTHFAQNQWRRAIASIDRAIALGHEFTPDLQDIHASSALSLETDPQHPQPFCFPVSPFPDERQNTFIRAASASVRLEHYHPVYGTRVIATNDIQPGDIVCLENPVATVSTDSFCWHCMQPVFQTIPCRSCTIAFFCSDSCRDICTASYHQYECPLMKTLVETYTDDNRKETCLLALRMVLMARDDLTKMRYVGLHDDDAEVSQFYDSSMKEAMKLRTNFLKRTDADYYWFLSFTAQVANLVKNHTTFFQHAETLEIAFCDVLMKQLQICYVNALKIRVKSLHQETVKIGWGLYPFTSRFNHSCRPNIVLINHGTKMVARANRVIKRGEQCFIEYIQNCASISYKERRNYLFERYNFDCYCGLCQKHEMISEDVIWCCSHMYQISFINFHTANLTLTEKLDCLGTALIKMHELKDCACFKMLQQSFLSLLYRLGNCTYR